EISDDILGNEDIKAIIISGTGRHFSSGADINDLLTFDPGNPHQAKDFYIANSETFKRFYTAKMPVIAAIKGVCIGSAMELAMSCHFRVAAENIVMGFPEAEYNLMTGCGGSVYLAAHVKKMTSIDMMLGGEMLDASGAQQSGLVDLIVKKDDVLKKAVNFAKRIYTNYNPDLRDYYVHKFLSGDSK
ncbi:MAG TPA: enoyl-CoA hydratase/isomerase family protein, partial [Syntrophomonas sp.]|nr:enoyl-CoA hydratase/isomerase family protein [Syntrophomonas sp.]